MCSGSGLGGLVEGSPSLRQGLRRDGHWVLSQRSHQRPRVLLLRRRSRLQQLPQRLYATIRILTTSVQRYQTASDHEEITQTGRTVVRGRYESAPLPHEGIVDTAATIDAQSWLQLSLERKRRGVETRWVV